MSNETMSITKCERLSEIPQTPRTCGVYFLYCVDKLVYIGSSVNIIGRITSHIKIGRFSFDRFSFIECDELTMHDRERSLIASNKPVNNTYCKNERCKAQLKQVPIEERAEKHLTKLVKKRKDAKLPYGRKAIVAEAILNLKG